tara:strand:- start:235 stop:495 length:261 start_codon:yes stop_codon:yes gene_type:complete
MNDENLYLLANPNFLLKKQKKSNHISNLFIILTKIFPNYNLNNLNDNDKELLLFKFENICKDFFIDKISSKLIDNLIYDIYQGFDN